MNNHFHIGLVAGEGREAKEPCSDGNIGSKLNRVKLALGRHPYQNVPSKVVDHLGDKTIITENPIRILSIIRHLGISIAQLHSNTTHFFSRSQLIRIFLSVRILHLLAWPHLNSFIPNPYRVERILDSWGYED